MLWHMVGSLTSGVTELRFILPQRQRMSDHLVLPEIQSSGKQRLYQTVVVNTVCWTCLQLSYCEPHLYCHRQAGIPWAQRGGSAFL